MGVLKVNVGDAVTPDWRKIGCGGAPEGTTEVAPWVWLTAPDRTGGATQTITFQAISNPGSYTAVYVDYYYTNTDGSTGFVSAGVPYPGSSTAVHSLTLSSLPAGAVLDYVEATFFSTTDYVILTWTAATVGRLKLWTGTQWVREKCDTDAGPTFTDDFNRADSTTSVGSAEWSTYTSDTASASLYKWGLRSGNAYPNGPSSGAANILHHDVGTTDYDFTVTYTGPNGKDVSNGVVFSFDLVTGAYRAWVNNGTAGSDGYGGGTGMILTGFPSIVTGDVLRVTCVGTAITLYQNGTIVATLTNTWSTSGDATHVGLYHDGADTTPQWDDVTIIAGVIAHPLKMWDGTTWQTVACLVPV